MALIWDWKKLSGTLDLVQGDREFTVNFYEGNALMIATYEYEEDGEQFYDMQWFFTGIPHAKNCLGLAKGHDNMFPPDTFRRMTIYRDNCRYWKDIIDLFVKAFPHINIMLLEKRYEQ